MIMIFRLRVSFSPAETPGFSLLLGGCSSFAVSTVGVGRWRRRVVMKKGAIIKPLLSDAWWLLKEDSTHIKRVFFVVVETLSWCCCLFFWLEDARDWLAPEAILKARPDATSNKVRTCVTEKMIYKSLFHTLETIRH